MSRHNKGKLGQHDFSKAPQVGIPRTRFNRTHTHKTTIDAGYLYPVYVDPVLPGDTFSLRMTALARISTLLFPIMDNLHMDVHFFFCPTRLVWSNFESFMGANIPDTDSSTDFILPVLEAPTDTGYATGSLFDYMGLPTLVTGTAVQPTSLPFRCFNQIYNDWYRDENYNDMVTVQLDDGPDPLDQYLLLHRNKRYDYFTSSLPFPQKGTAVSIPLEGNAPVISTNSAIDLLGHTSSTTGVMTYGTAVGLNVSNAGWMNNEDVYFGSSTGLEADLSGVAATTINALRLAATSQQMYEMDARGGTRYTEINRAHFQVTSPDMRLQRAEFLGSSTHRCSVTPVAQTAPSDVGGSGEQLTPQANLAAFGTIVVRDAGFTYSFQEHGYVFGIISVRADYTYWQGAERFWFDSARFDFYWPSFANIGEQAVLNQEIYIVGTSQDQEVFGYQEYGAHYRYKPSRLSGLFRPNATGSLAAWHLAQDFGSLPTLNDTFIAESPPMARIEAVADGSPDFILDTHIQLSCARPMPMYSIPGIKRL